MNGEHKRRYSDSEMERYREELERREAEKRIRAKKRRKRARVKRKIFSVFFIVLLLLCAVIILLKTPLFSVKTLSIEGNMIVSDEKIAEVSGLKVGSSILNHTSGYAEKALTSLPYISEAAVNKKLPSTVYIEVTELDGAYLLETDKRSVIVDKNGKSIAGFNGGEEMSLPIIKGGKDGNYKIGGYVKLSDEEKTRILLRCLECINEYGFSDITEINIEDEYNIYFVSRGMLKIKIGSLGSEDELSYKMAYIKEVMSKLPDNVKGVVDASRPEAGVSYRSEESMPEEGITENTEGEEEKTQEETENL